MPSPTPIVDLFRALSAALADLGVGWYVFGAQAVVQWGRPRFTEDVDVTVILGSHDARALIGRLQQSGFSLRDEGTPEFVARTRVVPLTHAPSDWAVDVVLAGPGLEEDFLHRAVSMDVAPGLAIPVISAEDLVVTKVLAGRPKDLDDARSVLVAQAERIDLERIRALLTDLERALGVSDLLPVLERLQNH